MARPLRVQYCGAVYHVMARGNHGQAIFKDDKDRARFLETFAEACQKTGWRICAYVLMTNHHHLLLQTPEPNLVGGMKWLEGTYPQRYNGRHQVWGHQFGRLRGRTLELFIDSTNTPETVPTLFGGPEESIVLENGWMEYRNTFHWAFAGVGASRGYDDLYSCQF